MVLHRNRYRPIQEMRENQGKKYPSTCSFLIFMNRVKIFFTFLTTIKLLHDCMWFCRLLFCCCHTFTQKVENTKISNKNQWAIFSIFFSSPKRTTLLKMLLRRRTCVGLFLFLISGLLNFLSTYVVYGGRVGHGPRPFTLV